MPQLDTVNIVTFVLIACFLVDAFIIFFLSKIKTLLIFVFNQVKKNSSFDANFFNFLFFHKSLFLKALQFKKFFSIF